MSDSSVQKREFDTYLAMINNSTGSNSWRNIYAVVNGEKKDVTKNGELSCSYFVSSILKIFSLVDNYHATVSVTVEDMERNNWEKVEKPEPGDVLLWAPRSSDPDNNEHLGFYIGDEKVVTNNYVSSKPEAGGRPEMVHWLYEGHPDGTRELVAVYRGKHLFKS